MEKDALLGTMPDEQVAKRLGRSVHAVRARRHQRHIRLRKQWRPADNKLLGKAPDGQLATRLGWTTSTVRDHRRQLGIPSLAEQQQTSLAQKLSAMSEQEIARLLRRSHTLVRRRIPSPGTRAPQWTAAEDRLLGQWPDERVARFLGRKLKGVQARRLKLGLRFAAPAKPWAAEEEQLLDPRKAQGPLRKQTYALARQLGRSVVAVRKHRRLKYGPVCAPGRRWTQHELRLLGTRLDREVAALTGRTCGNVQVKRCALAIPSFRARQKFRWTPARDRLLGTQPDRVLADRFGCSYPVLKRRRQALGIRSTARRPWTPQEERLVGTLRDEEVALRIGRTRKSVIHRRRALKLPQPRRQPRPPITAS